MCILLMCLSRTMAEEPFGPAQLLDLIASYVCPQDSQHLFHPRPANDQGFHKNGKSIEKGKRESALSGKWFIDAYQRYISSQDGDNCVFIPSCSEYCKQMFEATDPIHAMLQSADRLTRCNGIHPEQYPSDSLTGKNIDPVGERILFK